jgi:hypothetical protein
LDDLRGRPELSFLCALPVQAMACDADRVMQIIQLFAVEPDGLLATPAETFRPRRETKRDILSPVSLFDDNFHLLIFTARGQDMRRCGGTIRGFHRL